MSKDEKPLTTFGLIHSPFVFLALNSLRIDILLELLKEKGIISNEEYQQLFLSKMGEDLPKIFKAIEADAGLTGTNITVQPDGLISIDGQTIAFKATVLNRNDEARDD